LPAPWRVDAALQIERRVPEQRENLAVKWLWLAKPASSAISVRPLSLSSTASSVRASRERTT
jgi:hypothetical protein